MTRGVLEVASAVTGISPQSVPALKVIPVAATHDEPVQYNRVVLDEASEVVRQTSAVPAVNVRMERS